MEQDQLKEERIKKIKNIIEAEIGKEVYNKQNEVTEISEKIEKTLHQLDILKYVATVSYYEQAAGNSLKKSSGSDDNSSELKDDKVQHQIHPAVKKLLPFQSNYYKSFGEREYHTRQKQSNENDRGILSSKNVEEIKTEKIRVENEVPVKLPQCIPPLPSVDEKAEQVNSSRGVSKVKHRIIIGNVSKWISPVTREDNSTHKWMVYIRNQDKDKDVASLVRKVRYFLHESYKPHDIIDMTSSPFQLTRRGWGEFPIRVQLHFFHPLDKPVDIIHDLKLDMTCSGVQMLGAETVVEVSLRQSPPETAQGSKQDANYVNGRKKPEQQDVFDSHLVQTAKRNGIQNHFQNNYLEKLNHVHSSPKKKKEIFVKLIAIEHCYAKPSQVNSNSSEVRPFRTKLVKNLFGPENVLQMIGKKSCAHQFSRNEADVFNNLKASTRVGQDVQSKVLKQKYFVNVVQRLDSSKLTSVEPVLRWILQRWPIVTKMANDPAYRRLHPYSCPSEEDFFQYNIGKQRSAEWFRAKVIQKLLIFLKDLLPINETIWSTKQILLYSRHHGYSPFCSQPKKQTTQPEEILSKRLRQDSSSDSDDEDSCSSKKPRFQDRFFNGAERKRNLKKGRRKAVSEGEPSSRINYRNLNTYSSDTIEVFGSEDMRVLASNSIPDIDVVSESVPENPSATSPSKRKESVTTITTVPQKESYLSKLVSETSKQIGVRLAMEEVVPGVMCDSALRVMSASVSCFLEELLRRSLAHSWNRNGDKAPSSIERDDVLATLVEHPPFDIFTNRGLGKKSLQ